MSITAIIFKFVFQINLHEMKCIFAFMFVATIAFFSQTLQAQKKIEGFVITIEKDTINGFILDQTDAEMGYEIQFSRENNGINETTYSTKELSGFGFDYGRNFERMSIAENSNSTKYIFAKRVLGGRIDMLVWRRAKGDDPYLFLRNNQSGREVFMTNPPKKKVSKDAEPVKVMEKNKHIGLLNYVKSDSLNTVPNEKYFKYNRKQIKKNILADNLNHEQGFPVSEYEEQKKFTHDITMGMPVLWADGTSFRAAYFLNKTLPEKSRKLSLTRGVSYRYWKLDKEPDTSNKYSSQNFQQQYFSLIPIGVNFHAKSGAIRPYGYLGLGLAFLVVTYYDIENYKYVGDSNNFTATPTLNFGLGAKIKTGLNFILCEITLANGIYLNIGYSF